MEKLCVSQFIRLRIIAVPNDKEPIQIVKIIFLILIKKIFHLCEGYNKGHNDEVNIKDREYYLHLYYKRNLTISCYLIDQY